MLDSIPHTSEGGSFGLLVSTSMNSFCKYNTARPVAGPAKSRERIRDKGAL
jgi:hypothetical protein